MFSHRVLMVDDDPFAFSVLQTYLADMVSPPRLELATSYDEGIARLFAERFDVALLDYQLGKRSGLEFLRELHARGCRTPVVMLTGQRDHEIDMEAMKAGAVDYLVKGDFGPEVLERVIRYAAERGRTLEKLRESEERYALAVSGANDGIWDWRIEKDSLYLSPRWKQIIGLADDEMDNTLDAWMERVHPDDLGRFKFDLDAHASGGTSQLETEHRLLHVDGTWRWVLARAVAVRGSSGRATRISGSLTDVTHARSRDPLTGLPNRVLYQDRLERAFARTRRDKQYGFAVLFLDLDRFKVINDSLGHLAGDQLLVGIARRLENCIRGVDSVARLGGDEFTILLDGVTDPNEAIKVAERVHQELKRPFELDGRAVYSGTSVGIAMYRPEYKRPEEIIRDADTAMYRAKSAGRARYQIFDQQMHDEAMTLLQLESQLREAVQRKELRVVYQPVLRLRDGTLVGFEALVRWHHPTLGLITPDRFIALAEETGIIQQIDHWVLSTAAAQLGSWQASYPSAAPLYCAVNASKRQVDRPDFVEQTLAAIDSAGISRSAIALEITEGLIFEDPERVCAILKRLREKGVRVVMDDFGTGFSSLSYLHRLPLTGLKVDRSFVARLDDSGSGAETVKAIAALAHGFNLNLTAEGVETQEQEAQLRAIGCETAQGYLFSRPVEPAEIEAMLKKLEATAA